MSEESSPELANLSLRDLQQRLTERGLDFSYPLLSEFVRTDDIAEQLHAGGKGNRREFPPVAVDVLAAFLPEYRRAKARLPQAASMLRSFLSSPKQANSGALVGSRNGALVPVSEFRQTNELLVLTARVADLAEAIVTRAPVPDDALLTADEVSQILACSPATVRKRVRPVLRGRWRRSDVMRYIAGLGE